MVVFLIARLEKGMKSGDQKVEKFGGTVLVKGKKGGGSGLFVRVVVGCSCEEIRVIGTFLFPPGCTVVHRVADPRTSRVMMAGSEELLTI